MGKLRVTTWMCDRHDPAYEFTPTIRQALVVPKRRVGMDVLIATGIVRFSLLRQRDEVQAYLAESGIELSSGAISNMSDEFLVRWGLFHESLRPEFVKRLPNPIVLLDGTQEKGGQTTYRALDAATGITLHAACLPSESTHAVAGFLTDLKRWGFSPRAFVRDGSSAAKAAIDRVFPGVPQQLCHTHFLRDAGVALLAAPHDALSNAVLTTGELAHLNELARSLRSADPSDERTDVIRAAIGVWVRLLVEHVDGPRQKRGDTPFRLPYVEVVENLRDARNYLSEMIRFVNEANVCVPALLDAKERIDRILTNEPVLEAYMRARRLNSWFLEVRTLMRLERISLSEQVNAPALSKHDVEQTLARVHGIQDEARTQGAWATTAWEKVVRRFERHAEELWVHAGVPGMCRVTNALEGKHRDVRMAIRRRTGRGSTSAEMERVGELLSLWDNVTNPWFVNHYLTGVDLRAAFLAQDSERVKQGIRALTVKRWRQRLPVQPQHRPVALQGLLTALRGGGLTAIRAWAEEVQGIAPPAD